jgi:putative membrane protein
MNRLTYMLALAALACAAPCGAQSFGNPAGMAPDTPGLDAARPAKDHPNVQDKLFVRLATLGGRAEVRAGRLAADKGSAEPVRAFGERMVAEHEDMNDGLARLDDVNPEVPDGLDPVHETMLQALEGKAAGPEFDLAYIASQIEDHQKMVNLLMWELSFGQSEKVKRLAAEALPAVLDHLETARTHHAELAGLPPPNPAERGDPRARPRERR